MGPRVDPPRSRRRDAGSRLNTRVHAISRATSLQEARSRLHDADPVMARLIDARPDFDPHAWIAQLANLRSCSGKATSKLGILGRGGGAHRRRGSAYG